MRGHSPGILPSCNPWLTEQWLCGYRQLMLFKKLILFRGDLILIVLTLIEKKKKPFNVNFIQICINGKTKINFYRKSWSNQGKILVVHWVGNVEISLWQMLEKLTWMIDGNKLEALKVSWCIFLVWVHVNLHRSLYIWEYVTTCSANLKPKIFDF